MTLSMYEQILLMIYYYLYHERYDVSENRSINVEKCKLLRNRKMQSAVFLAKRCGVLADTYTFDDLEGIPLSTNLQAALDKLTEKENDIRVFYDKHYNNASWFRELMGPRNYDRMIHDFNILGNLTTDEAGIELACSMINIIRNRRPDITSLYDLKTVIDADGIYKVDMFVMQKAWGDLCALNIVDVNKDIAYLKANPLARNRSLLRK